MTEEEEEDPTRDIADYYADIPIDFKGLRCCLRCSLLKSYEQVKDAKQIRNIISVFRVFCLDFVLTDSPVDILYCITHCSSLRMVARIVNFWDQMVANV